MKRNRIPFRLSPGWCFIAASGLLLLTGIAFGAVEEGSGNTSPQLPKIVREEVPRTFLQQIDHAFEVSVNWTAKVLFYTLFADKREYVVFQHEEHFVRPAGSDEPFRRLEPKGTYPAATLTGEELQRLNAQEKLLTAGGEYVLNGTLERKPIEFATLMLGDEENSAARYGGKYVKQDDGYHRVRKLRGLLSDEDVLSQEQVEDYAAKGWLQGGSGRTPDWLHEESVGGAPLVVLWLFGGAIFFTLYFGFVNIWGFQHAVSVVRGKYDSTGKDGEVTHRQALSSALSATVGLGNIAGVTIAMTAGGPGAFFWMLLCGIFGMTSKFTECTLGVKYRLVKPDGTVLGGPMRYLRVGLAELKLGGLGIVLSTLFAVMCLLASFGGGNMFQANQSGSTLLATVQHRDKEAVRQLDEKIKQAAAENDSEQLHALYEDRSRLTAQIDDFARSFKIAFGLILAAMVAVVIIGGIKRIGKAAEMMVPGMCLLYIFACLWIILQHAPEIPAMVGQIFSEAFTGKAVGGGILGVMIMGIRRASFSNEAGIGSAAIAHSAARTDEPIREGKVALLEPFIDTVVVCSMTALVILISGAWNQQTWIEGEGLEGAALTARAFRAESPGFSEELFPWLLSISVVLFAYSTIISWSYYGERAWESLFGSRTIAVYRILAVICVFVGTIFSLGAVLDFSDMMILAMAFPNIIGLLLLAPGVKRDLASYWQRCKAGEFEKPKSTTPQA